MKKMKMQLLGHFRLEDEAGKVLKEEELRSEKLIKILAYLLIYRNRVVTQQKLSEMLLYSDVKNPENTIRNLVYRLRNALKIFGEEEFICSYVGAYQWNPAIEVETDYEKFEQLALYLKKASDFENIVSDAHEIGSQKELCVEILKCYNNNITMKLSGEIWMIPMVVWFRKNYLDAAKRLCRICEAEKKWHEIEQLCLYTLVEDPYDEELHSQLIRSLYAQKRTEEALKHYENTKQLFYKNFGAGNLEKLEQVYREMLETRDEKKVDMDLVMESMQQKKGAEGGILCNYQVFRELYRIEVKRVSRIGIPTYIVMLTLRRTNSLWEQRVADPGLLKLLGALESVVCDSLRSSDVATRMNELQILVMLPGCSFEGVLAALERMQKKFQKHIGKKQVELVCELKEIPVMRE